MPTTLGAIDVGSNAIRLLIGRIDNDRKLAVIDNLREPVRLGRDVFTRRTISDDVMEQASDAFRRFKEAIDRNGVTLTRAVATSALREAMNRDTFVNRIAQVSGIDIAVIGAEEEARLVHLAVSEKMNLQKPARHAHRHRRGQHRNHIHRQRKHRVHGKFQAWGGATSSNA